MKATCAQFTSKLRSADYPVHVGSNFLASFGSTSAQVQRQPPNRALFVLTSPGNLVALGQAISGGVSARSSSLRCSFCLPANTTSVSMQVERLSTELAAAGADRSSLLIAFGGGIVGDVGGFLAAIYMRGIDYIQMPTTLLAQVDSSVGGKTGVNLATGKNLIGSFHHPRAVFADVGVLETLPARELRAGLFESIKAGIIRDASLFRFLESNRRV